MMMIPYFGRWPAWIDLFVESCKWNPSIRWRLFTDCGTPANRADNVDFVHVSFADYKRLVRERLGIAFDPPSPYKLNDLKPCLGHIHERDIADYPCFGYGDLDVIYGNLRAFYTDELLARYGVLSTHPERLSGHFAVLRNTSALRRAFERVPTYRKLLEQPNYVGIEEAREFTAVFTPPAGERRGWWRRLRDRWDPCRRESLFVERYTTVLSPRGWHDGTMNYPLRWNWRNGRLTNDRDGDREFMYLHFMRWHSGRWMPERPAPTEAAWSGRDDIVQIDWRQAAREGFSINPEGFTPLEMPLEMPLETTPRTRLVA
jgi:hypothetical protein